MLWLRLLVVGLSLGLNSLASESEEWCRGSLPGDCDPYTCGGSCESKYIRFMDRTNAKDRTVKSCFCQQEKMCSIIGMHAYSGCRTYSSLSTAGQKLIRYWSMDTRDRRNRHANDFRSRYTDKIRHQQLLNGNSRFCCRTMVQKGPALHLKSSSTPNPLPAILGFLALLSSAFLTV